MIKNILLTGCNGYLGSKFVEKFSNDYQINGFDTNFFDCSNKVAAALGNVIQKDIRNLKVILKYEGPIVAPVQKGEKIAELIVLNKDEKIKTLPLFAHEDLKKVNFFKSLITSINYLIWGDV